MFRVLLFLMLALLLRGLAFAQFSVHSAAAPADFVQEHCVSHEESASDAPRASVPALAECQLACDLATPVALSAPPELPAVVGHPVQRALVLSLRRGDAPPPDLPPPRS